MLLAQDYYKVCYSIDILFYHTIIIWNSYKHKPSVILFEGEVFQLNKLDSKLFTVTKNKNDAMGKVILLPLSISFVPLGTRDYMPLSL